MLNLLVCGPKATPCAPHPQWNMGVSASCCGDAFCLDRNRKTGQSCHGNENAVWGENLSEYAKNVRLMIRDRYLWS